VQADDDVLDAAEEEDELRPHSLSNGNEELYISVPDGEPLPADIQTIKSLSYTQAFNIYKVRML
jgi:hypothetical protein